MTDEYRNICRYKQAMLMAKSMLNNGIISKDDYLKIDEIIAKKYGINLCSIYRQIA